MEVRRQGILASIGLLAVFWGLALLVALNDIDFFSFADLFDLREPHHEHIVVALLFIGLVAAAVPLVRGVLHRESV